jgi:hypothetical protein
MERDEYEEPLGERNWIIPIAMVVFAVVAAFVGLMNNPEETRRHLTPEQLEMEALRESDARAGFAVQPDSAPVSRPLSNAD